MIRRHKPADRVVLGAGNDGRQGPGSHLVDARHDRWPRVMLDQLLHRTDTLRWCLSLAIHYFGQPSSRCPQVIDAQVNKSLLAGERHADTPPTVRCTRLRDPDLKPSRSSAIHWYPA